MEDPILTRAEVAQIVRRSPATLRNLASMDRGPRPMTPKGASRALYLRSEVLRWIREGDRSETATT